MDMDLLIEKITEEIYQKLRNEKSLNTGSSGGSSSNCKNSGFCNFIDHTLLKAEATESDVKKLCKEAMEHRFVSVCVNPWFVPLSRDCLKGSDVKVCTVIGFPLGATTTKTKVYEAREAVENGAKEVDMVINVGAVKSGDWDYVKNDIESIYMAVSGRALLKVIIETSLLTDEEKVRVCAICKMVGVDFVKTSTGFSTGGATVEDVSLMRKVVGSEIGVKASGGIKEAATAKAMIDAGANRLGTSSGVVIVCGACGKSTGKPAAAGTAY
ncbi:MAG: deoxyribose-phosphate aldolase [Oscillospiraceae bacterium]|nr:deoxyribose-phosphate aldolase [Oscillospiraceae bacterium]MCL2277796.1 deoxyribose-phosphate aldolase [Oscillospiraceae bacterium]